jgi:hypothetical protein
MDAVPASLSITNLYRKEQPLAWVKKITIRAPTYDNAPLPNTKPRTRERPPNLRAGEPRGHGIVHASRCFHVGENGSVEFRFDQAARL